MRLAGRTRKAISLTILGCSMAAWVLLVLNPGHILGVVHCHISDAGPSTASLQMLLFMNPTSSLLTGWGLMVVAMMLPKLIMPVCYIYVKALKRRRLISALLFIFGYVGVWMTVGVLMIAAILSINLLVPGSYVPAIVVAVITVGWQFSPVKQYCLNRGHEHPLFAAFGWPAFRDALFFGVKHGLWCVGSGWALMLFPMLLPVGHHLAMAFVTFVMLSEHWEHPQLPRWRIRLHGKLTRMLLAQTQITIKRTFASSK